MTQGKFYCNTRAVNPSERAHHKLLTDRLVAERTQIAATEKSYEFQYSPSTVSLAELADRTPQEFAQAAMQRSFGLSAAERPNDSTQDAVCVERLK